MVKRHTPELDRLTKRVRVHLKARGSVRRLADHLGVSQSTLSDWLRGRYEPGGEVTLKLQKWVIAAEAEQQKETAAMLVTSQRRKTRSTNTINESKPDRK